MNKIISSIIIFILILVSISPIYAKVHSSHRTSVKSSTSTSAKSTISNAKSYATPKNFTSKYNSSNIKTEKIKEASNYSSYSATNMFTPNFWTAMWLFSCMNNNTRTVTEQDIAKELEERGYTDEEIRDILTEGEEAKLAQQEEDNNVIIWVVIIAVILITFLIVSLFIIY